MMIKKRLLVQVMILVFVLSLIVFSGWFGYCLSKHCYTLGIIIIGISTVLAGWIFLSALQRLTKRSWLIVLLFLLLCGWGLVVYQPDEYSETIGHGFIKL